MAGVTSGEAASRFTELLKEACAGVDDPWFLLPVSSSDSKSGITAYRERVYCYELYHQLRLQASTAAGLAAGAPEYTVSGEIDKAGLNAITDGGREKPDLAWHVPGELRNAVVLEVKSARASSAGIRKDLKTLSTFLSAGDRAYRAGILLVYGDAGNGSPDELVRRTVDSGDVDRDKLRNARLYWHPAPRSRVEDLGPLY
jgi:hypothetical protein